MKIKPPSSVPGYSARIDGVAYGNTPNGCTGNLWTYPLSSPSFFFNTSNDTIRGLDILSNDLTDSEMEAWLAWVDELLQRELCLLWKSESSGRTDDERAVAGYINCNMWRGNTNQPYSTTPPYYDIVPAGDTLNIVNPDPLTINWDRPTGNPLVPTYMAMWAQTRSTAPAANIQPQKMKWVTNFNFTMNEDTNIQPLIDELIPKWNGSYIQLGLAAGVQGSCPFMAAQIGQQQ